MKERLASLLTELERLKHVHGADTSQRKIVILNALESPRLRTARQVFRLHEVLLFLRGYPDDPEVFARVERMLEGFAGRPDLRRHRAALAATGIAGTVIPYRFFAQTASWLARRWGRHLTIDWKEFDGKDKLEPLLPLLALYAETPGLDELAFGVREWLGRLKGPAETDASFLVRRFDALRMDSLARETIYDGLDVPMVLAPGPDTPSRTRARLPGTPIAYQTRPLSRSVALREEVARPPGSVRQATRLESRTLIDLARGMMVTLNRDLDVFSYGDENDVRIAQGGEGLVFAFIGFVPERRLMLEVLYGYLILKNGVPMGYGTVASLFQSSEIAYNVSEAFRGGEAALVFARLLACVRSLFGSECFCLVPYQLGEDNPEALRSGAWWFYQKLGFRAKDAAVLRLMGEELRRRKRRPSHRSSAATLKKLASASVFFHVGPPRDDVIGALPLANVGLNVTRYLAGRFGSDRERAARICSRDTAELLRVRSFGRFSAGERLAWQRWSPLVRILPGIDRWTEKDRRGLAEVIRAKGGARESDFVFRFDAHRRLRRAMEELARDEPSSPE